MFSTTHRPSVGHLFLGIWCLLIGIGLVPLPAAAQEAPVSPAPSPLIEQMVRLTNRARSQRGLDPYLLNPLLSQVAQAHVNDIIASGNLGHVGSDGSRAPERVRRAGYNASLVSENWVYSRALEKGFAWWLADPPHYENLMHRHYREIGVGMAVPPNGWGQVWVMLFAASADGGTAADAVLIADAGEPAPAVDSAGGEALVTGSTYIVQPGDTLEAIGRRLGIPWLRIAQLNDIKDPTRLQAGQVLDIPDAAPPAVTPPADAPAPEQAAPPPLEPPAAVQPADAAPQVAPQPPTTYTVQAGDALASIAGRFGLTWQTLAQWNGLNAKSILRIGQVLRLTAPAQASAAPPAPAPTVYRVRAGDSLSAIAARFGSSWQTLARLNGLNSASILRIGQTLRLR